MIRKCVNGTEQEDVISVYGHGYVLGTVYLYDSRIYSESFL